MLPLFQLDPLLLTYLLAVMLLAGWVHGALGLGFPMVATPLIAIWLDVRIAIFLTLLPTVAVNMATIFADSLDRQALRQFGWLLVFTAFGAGVGAYVLAYSSPNPFRVLLALLIVLFLLQDKIGQLQHIWLQYSPRFLMAVVGFVAGFSGGTTNVMVAVLLVYFFSIKLPRMQMLPVLNGCFLLGKLVQIAVFVQADLVDMNTLVQTLPLALAALLALLLGQRLQARLPVQTYRQLLDSLLVFLVVVLLLQAAADGIV